MYSWSELRPFVPWLITTVSLSYVMYIHYKLKHFKPPINPDFDKYNKKHVLKAANFEKGKRQSYCRCWKSKTFPLCDGSHKQHNKEHNDSTGPVVIEYDEEDDFRIEDNQSMNASTDEPLSSLEMIEESDNGNGNNENNLIDI